MFERDGHILSDLELVNSLNNFYTSVNADIPPLDYSELPAFLPAFGTPPLIESYQVYEKLRSLQSFKSTGPDNIPSRILREFAYEFADPVAIIFNKSLKSGIFPNAWKDSFITPIPKVSQPVCEEDTRPISLTSCLAKVLEDFVVRWMSDVENSIDIQKFGCLRGSSTAYCLLDMIQNWLSHLDPPDTHIRLLFLDYSKAFERIGHNILINKLINIGVRRCLIPWIISFLSYRRQCVKLGNTTSTWLPSAAGVPQGTKLGPILFLIMINDLKISSPQNTRSWKFMDDVSNAEYMSKYSESHMQDHLNEIKSWSDNNFMKLNPKKCKEMQICFYKERPIFNTLTLDDYPLEIVSHYKVLGLVLQDNLKWNEHVAMIITKASKRLHILRVLKRGGIPPSDLILIYNALIRSVLEYCCIVWHNGLPGYLADSIERVQRRAMNIISPGKSYYESLIELNCPRLDDRREALCKKTFEKIIDGNRLSYLLPRPRDNVTYDLRNFNQFLFSKCRTDRYKNSFFPSMFSKLS